MKQIPKLTIRPFVAADSAQVQTLVSDARVAKMAGNIPYPYPQGCAQDWIASHAAQHRSGTAIIRAIVCSDTMQCVGAISIDQMSRGLNSSGNLGYWVGVPYWNRGFRLFDFFKTGLNLCECQWCTISCRTTMSMSRFWRGTFFYSTCKHFQHVQHANIFNMFNMQTFF